VKFVLEYEFNSCADWVGFVVDKVTLALVFPQDFCFLESVSSTKAQHKYLFILSRVTATYKNG
jgi:hypothetical protein